MEAKQCTFQQLPEEMTNTRKIKMSNYHGNNYKMLFTVEARVHLHEPECTDGDRSLKRERGEISVEPAFLFCLFGKLFQLFVTT